MCAMFRRRIGAGAAVLFALVVSCAAHAARAQSSAGRAPSLVTKLHAQRLSPNDLELSGDLAGLARGETRYLTREDLLSASPAMTISPDDGNFKSPSQARGVALEDLARALGVPANDMVIAICKDKYRGHYSRSYLTIHHPVLVMELDGKPLPGSPPEEGGDDPGPYLIAHASFKPAFKILSHSDEAQIPWGVVRLEFRDQAAVFGAISPRGAHAADVPVQNGFRIAQQNCFRCHNNGAEGGLKSGVTWTVLAALASTSPDFFTEYVRDPKSQNPKTQMAASPEYDDATMRALIAYFKTFAPAAPPEAH